MIQRKRINNDIFVRWEILNPDDTAVDLTDVLSIKAEARPQSTNASIPVTPVVVGSNLVEIQLPAKKQKYIGMYNLYLEYTKTDDSVEGGIATYTLDYTNAFELVPKTTLIPSPDDDPINIEGIIASFTYSMLTNAEKADLASRLNDDPGGGSGGGYGVLGLFADAYAISVDSSDVSTPPNVKIKALPVNANTLVWTIAINNGEFQSITSNSSPYAEVFLSGSTLTINSTTLSRKVYSIKVTDGITTTGVNIIRFKASEDTATTDTVTTTQFNNHVNNLNNEKHLTAAQVAMLDYWKLDGNGNLYTTYNIYSTGEVSAYGASSGGGGDIGGVTFLSGLNDVALSLPIQNGQVLKYSTSTNKWINAAESGGSSGGPVAWSDITGKPSSYVPTSHTHFSTDIIGLETLLSSKMNTPSGTSSQYIAGDGTLKTFPAVGGTGTVTGITAGNGMNFTNITTTGTITLGTPSSITLSTTNSSYTNSHTHAFNPGGTTAQYINGAGTLSNFPTIATPNNGTLSLTTEKGLTGSATFTANQAGNSTFTISPTYGITSNTFAQGNDSRIINGQAAYDWGNHASVGYVTSSSLNSYVAKTDSLYIGTTAVPLNRTSGTLDLNGIGVLSATRVSTGSSVYFGNYGNFEGLVYDAEGAVIIGINESNYATYLGYGNVGIGTQTPSASLHVIGNTLSTAYKLASGWSFESSGTELQIKYNGAVRNRILSDGSFVSVGEITAYGAASSGSGSTDFLSLSQGGDVLGKVGFTGTTYPQIRGNGTQLVLSHSDQVNTGTVYLVNNTLRRGASTTMTLGDASYLWANTYTDKITLGNGWTIEQTSSSLTIKINGVVKSTINA